MGEEEETKIKDESCSKPQPAAEFARGGGRGRGEIISKHLSVSDTL